MTHKAAESGKIKSEGGGRIAALLELGAAVVVTLDVAPMQHMYVPATDDSVQTEFMGQPALLLFGLHSKGVPEVPPNGVDPTGHAEKNRLSDQAADR